MATEDASETAAFREVLDDETFVDLGKLRDIAQYGIPPELRGEVWLYLLKVIPAERTKQDSEARERHAAYARLELAPKEHAGRIKGAVSRFCSKHRFTEARERALHSVVVGFLDHSQIPFSHALVAVAGTLSYAIEDEVDLFFALSRVMELAGRLGSLSSQLGAFNALFRTSLRDIHQKFEDEELPVRTWASSWLEGLLAQELPFDCVLRLWDSYFARESGLAIHPYVCLTIMESVKDDLEEMEQMDLRSFLKRLLPIDTEEVLVNAENLLERTQHLLTV